MFRVSAAAAGAFAALAVLVAEGKLTSVDQWAIDRAMPGARFKGTKPSVADALIPLWHARWHGSLHVAAELVTVPASLVPASLLFLVCLRWLGRPAVWAALYVLGNAVEELAKSTLTRPALHHGALHLAAFDASYPSGHALRALLLAAAVGVARPRLRIVAAVWAAAAVAMLEVGGFHVPSDIAGGLLLATLLLAWGRLQRGSPATQTAARGTRAS